MLGGDLKSEHEMVHSRIFRLEKGVGSQVEGERTEEDTRIT